MSIANSTRSNNIQIVIAGILSVLAQGLLLLPADLTARIPLPHWGSLSVGITIFAISTIWIVINIRVLKTGWRGNAHFILNQAVIVTGILILMDSSASDARLGGFVLTSLITALTVYGIIVNTSSPVLVSDTDDENAPKRKGFTPPPEIDHNIEALKEQASIAGNKLNTEKQRTTQLNYLIELSHQLQDELDPPIAAQLAINTLERAVKCTVVSLMTYEPEDKEFIALASGGSMANVIPPGHRHSSETGIHGRVTRQKKTIIFNDTTQETDFTPINNENTRSVIVVPIMTDGQLKGMLEVRSDKIHAFNNMDIANVEGIATELSRAWERSNYNQRLTELIQSGISLTTLLDPQAAVEEIAILARKTFEAHFVFVTLLGQQGDFSRTAHAGDAPRLLNSLSNNPAEEPLIQAALNATQPFRVRDLRKYTKKNNLDIDKASLRGVLAIPIRLHRLSIGTILAFGKKEAVFFSEKDETLSGLLSSQAAASVESSWLYHELRNKEHITSMLRHLSEDVILTEEIGKAAETITRWAHKATTATETGIIIMSPDGTIHAEVELDATGFHSRGKHPMSTIQQAIQLGEKIIITKDAGVLACYPLKSRSRSIGALWILIPESRGQNFGSIELLVNQAAVSLERVNLLAESRRQAREIEAAYEVLEETYDQTLKALMSALDARDRETEGHSMRVSQLACLLGEKIGLNGDQLKALERGALLHDIGKIGISDTILHKPGKLTEDEWKIMRMHPEIGARIVERIPFLQESMSVVRYHHERWDGSGYPLGIKGTEIPVQARIFAVVDVFDALTSKRSYRKKSIPDEAIQYLKDEAGVLFDADIVNTLSELPYGNYIEVDKIP
ncbi:MAG TPA: HD domain-containing phosphohydrolase [Anaerolineales bacterium]|nr:HD domain-containing phosphohydrolase [Anaerolineales bacterium]